MCDYISPPRNVITLRARESPSVLREIPPDIRTGMLNAPFALGWDSKSITFPDSGYGIFPRIIYGRNGNAQDTQFPRAGC